MTHKHFFEWNIPAANQFSGQTDRYIDVVATWDDKQYYADGRPMVFISPAHGFDFHDAFQVKDWFIAKTQIERIATNHFTELARTERIAQARAVLVNEGEPTGNPVLDRFTESEKDLIIQETLS